jgi:CheY-like chemotaxis protein
MAHILIVEDSEDSREALRLLLEGQGHRVTLTDSGEAAIATAAGTRPDLVIIDIGLPGIDGYETARRIRARDEAVRLVALTGHNRREDRDESLAAGFDAHFPKPLDPVRILTLLRPGGP